MLEGSSGHTSINVLEPYAPMILVNEQKVTFETFCFTSRLGLGIRARRARDPDVTNELLVVIYLTYGIHVSFLNFWYT